MLICQIHTHTLILWMMFGWGRGNFWWRRQVRRPKPKANNFFFPNSTTVDVLCSFLCLRMPCRVCVCAGGALWRTNGSVGSIEMNCSWLPPPTPHTSHSVGVVSETTWEKGQIKNDGYSNCAGTHPRYSSLYPHPCLNAVACHENKKHETRETDCDVCHDSSKRRDTMLFGLKRSLL